jgi:hypothetical protein
MCSYCTIVGLSMPSLKRLTNATLYMYGGQAEHPPPHCHLRGPDSDCSIELASLTVTIGRCKRSDLNEAIA